ncbi:MAG: serine/threonine-protein kinase, partial [Bacteroidota bacterium]
MADQRFLHYRLLRPLGAGGMGEVFLAEDERLGRRVALKFLPQADTADPERRERLRREARALASLSHPGIATVHALEEHGDRLFLVMEYVEGETLADRIAKRPLPVNEVIERGLRLAEALAHAHTRGVIHRDIKPSNVLITPEGGTKLADFGLALLADETRLTAEGVSAGTADHMSPEQTRGAALDARSDLFSLGVVLYESLTGVRPFARSNLEATFHAVRSEDPEPPTALRSGIPLELERIVMKLMRKDPAERYQTAADLAADLRALHSRASGSPPSQPRPAGVPAPDALTETTLAPAGSGPRIGAAGRNRLARRLLAGAAALAFLIFLILVIRDRAGIGARNAEAAPRSIAVLSFQQMAEPSDPHGVAAM